MVKTAEEGKGWQGVEGIMLPANITKQELQDIFADIDFLIDPAYDFGNEELEKMRSHVIRLKEIHKLN